MALTKDFKQTIQDMVNSDPKFAVAMLNEAGQLLLAGEPATARLMLRDLVNATIGFEPLSVKTSIPVKSLHRMLTAEGNPNMESLSTILKSLQCYLQVDLKVVQNEPYENPPEPTFAVSESEYPHYAKQSQKSTDGERNLGSEFTVRGAWWLASEPKRQIPGVLSFGPERISLSLDGLFDSNVRRDLLDEEVVLQGVDTTGRRWTLSKAFETAINPAMFGGHKTSEFNVHLAFEGAHFDTENDLQLATLSIEISDLRASLGKSGFRAKLDEPKSVDISYRSPPGFCIEIPKLSATLEATRFWTGSFEWYETTIRSSSRLELHYSAPRTFSVASSAIFQLANLLSILHARPALLTDVRAVTTGGQIICVYFAQKANLRRDRRHEILLAPLGALTDDLSEIVNNWFDLNDQAQTAINVFCNLWRNPGPFGQSDFMQYVQTLESFHRSLQENLYLPETQYRNLVSTPLKPTVTSLDVSSELRKRISEQLKLANQLTQKDRFRQLFKSLPAELAHLLAPDVEEFVKRAVDTRNYITHLDFDYKKHSMTSDKIPFETAGLQLLFIMLVLTKLKVPTDLILRNLPETTLFKKFQHRARKTR